MSEHANKGDALHAAAYCTVCGARSLRPATFGTTCNLLQRDLTRCPGTLIASVTPPGEGNPDA